MDAISLDLQHWFHVFGHSGAIFCGLSALDIALWDHCGKAVGRPIYRITPASAFARRPLNPGFNAMSLTCVYFLYIPWNIPNETSIFVMIKAIPIFATRLACYCRARFGAASSTADVSV
ncbi:hypothetical protein [Cupriavidus necator]|uniref:hypothetical protein n=1 Tax=Cupriavidus necator TaxID=106590 RepID=UPI001F43E634|nr:hypothetical protein [Cupriavidus necator]